MLLPSVLACAIVDPSLSLSLGRDDDDHDDDDEYQKGNGGCSVATIAEKNCVS